MESLVLPKKYIDKGVIPPYIILDTWYTEDKYIERHYEIGQKNPTYPKMLFLITGEDDKADVPFIPIPVYSPETNILVTDMRGLSKKGLVSGLDLVDYLPSKGLGLHKLNTAVFMHADLNGELDSIRHDLIKVFVYLLSSKISEYLSLDTIDKETIEKLLYISFYLRLYGEDIHANVILKNHLKNVKLEEVERLLGLLIKEQYPDKRKGILDYFHFLLHLDEVETSHRAKVDMSALISITNTIVPANFKLQWEVGQYVPSYWIGVLYSNMTNSFYKKGYIYTKVKKASRFLNYTDIENKLEKVLKRYDAVK